MTYCVLVPVLRGISSVQTDGCRSASETAFGVYTVKPYLATALHRKSCTRKSTFFFARTTESFGASVGTAMLGKSQFTMLLVGIAVSRSLERSPSLTGLS